MSRILDSVYAGDESLGTYYEKKLHVILTSVWRHKLLVITTLAAALVIGVALSLIMPKRYTAEAYVRGGFGVTEAIAPEVKGEAGGVIALDPSLLVETRARLLQSQQLARRVVQRLGLERIASAVSENRFSSWWRAWIYGDTTKTLENRTDLAAKRLLGGLSVKTEPRVYLVVVSYTAKDPELASLITNTFVVEFLQTLTLQYLSSQREVAERELFAELATLGAKHPKVVEARARLAAADALLRAESGKTPEEIQRAAGGIVGLAQVDPVPSSPNPPILIGLALLVGLVSGVAMALWRTR